ncbi:response regulator [Christiangramia salexigens]|uniref:response regulator n=1 Tax=Christiangramia salexigens TaxID=1913577 RepID=UPI0018DC8AE3|nr:response regulator [Christiangramia salexigens]
MVQTLLIDDDKIIGLLHNKLVSKFNFPGPKVFVDAESALHYIMNVESDRIKKFIVFLDINMPGLDGWGFLKKSRSMALEQKLCVFILTSSIDLSDKLKAQSYPEVEGFIEKPLTAVKLREIMCMESMIKVITKA